MARIALYMILIVAGSLTWSGCSRVMKAETFDPTQPSLVTGQWSGTWWVEGRQDQALPLSATCLQTGPNEWTASFHAVCGREAAYTFDLPGKRKGDAVYFEQTVDLGPEDGGIYHWTGKVTSDEFTGEYENKKYVGGFKMTKAASDDLSKYTQTCDIMY